jgi:hypothetical protein
MLAMDVIAESDSWTDEGVPSKYPTQRQGVINGWKFTSVTLEPMTKAAAEDMMVGVRIWV